MRKPIFAYAKTKAQISSVVTVLAFVLASLIAQSYQNFKPLALFYGGTAQFVSDQVGNPEDRFSRDTSHILLYLL